MLRVAELFAGVGGFRIGLEKTKKYEVVWSNQWEPSTKLQHASIVYDAKFKTGYHTNEDIAQVSTEDIPDHDVLVGGFPCQDYSVASTLKNSKGLVGKKGVLWWSIHRILNEKKNKKPKYLILENVDRLLKSPSNQRGRDFAVILKSLEELDYAAEWRVINAAEYGMPQRRRRVFIVGYHKSTKEYKVLKKTNPVDSINKDSVLSKAFPIYKLDDKEFSDITINGDLVEISESFNLGKKLSPFQNAGVMIEGHVTTAKPSAKFNGKSQTLGDILEEEPVSAEFYLDKADEEKWKYLKGAKKEIRKTKDGFEYNYAEGGMIFPDALDNASRTIITGEGGKSASRFKHVIKTERGLRRLTPIELERLNEFPDNHTQLDGITPAKRAFFMGNALVVGVVERIGKELAKRV